MPISQDWFWTHEVAATKELDALRTALAEHERVRGENGTVQILREMIADRRRFLGRVRL